MQKRKTGGRKAGTPNVISGLAKENIVAVFTRLGGTAAMAEWARKNQTEFYKLYARLVPVQVAGEVTHRHVARLPTVEKTTEEWARQYTPTLPAPSQTQ